MKRRLKQEIKALKQLSDVAIESIYYNGFNYSVFLS